MLHRNSSYVGHKVAGTSDSKNSDDEEKKTSEDWLNEQMEKALFAARMKMAKEYLDEMNEQAYMNGDEHEMDIIEALKKDMEKFVAEHKDELDKLLAEKEDKMDTDDGVNHKRSRQLN